MEEQVPEGGSPLRAASSTATPLAWFAAGFWPVVLSGFLLLGADLLWVVSLGDTIRATGAVPTRIPNLVAPQAAWHNPVVVAEVFLSWVNSSGWAALPALNMAIVVATFLLLVVDGRAAGGVDRRLALSLSLVALGASASFVVVRFPMLSLVPFVVLVAMLRSWDRSHGRTIWWVPVLMVLWGNLHGAVLVGLALLAAFVVGGGRRGAATRIAVALLSLASLVLTSAGLRTPSYYVQALSNEAAARGTDLWARPDLTQPLDIALVVCATCLVLMAARSLRLWEWVAVVGLGVATLSAARHGVWLLLFLAPVAAVPSGRRRSEPLVGRRVTRRALGLATAVLLSVSLAIGVQIARRSEEVRPAGEGLVPALAAIARGGTVLAPEPEAETFALHGIQVWAANPIDAFDRGTQSQLLDFLHRCDVPPSEVDVVVAVERCVPEVQRQGWSVAHRAGNLTVLTR